MPGSAGAPPPAHSRRKRHRHTSSMASPHSLAFSPGLAQKVWRALGALQDVGHHAVPQLRRGGRLARAVWLWARRRGQRRPHPYRVVGRRRLPLQFCPGRGRRQPVLVRLCGGRQVSQAARRAWVADVRIMCWARSATEPAAPTHIPTPYHAPFAPAGGGSERPASKSRAPTRASSWTRGSPSSARRRRWTGWRE